MQHSTIVDNLVRLGMIHYEAMVYVALIDIGEGTARQVHEQSGVPRTRIYDILDMMEKKGYVEVFQNRPRCYRAIPVERMLHIFRDDFEDSISFVSKELNDRSALAKQRTFPIWHIKGSISLKNQIAEMLLSAKKEVILVCPRISMLRSILEPLKELNDSIDVVCVSAGSPFSFKEDLPKVRFVNPTISNDSFAEIYSSTFNTNGKKVVEGSQTKAEMLVIIDGVRSILVYQEKDEQIGVIFELPIIPVLQKGAVNEILKGRNHQ